ncbi:MAG: ankyrin repeat domain-containing protein [Planctomycetota bacterium]|jgi:ankyrin repeat protein
MKHLPLKLGIAVVLLFGMITAACFLWTPLRVRYYTAKLKSDDPKERIAGVDGFLGMGKKGVDALAGIVGGGNEEAWFLNSVWNNINGIAFMYTTPLMNAAINDYKDAVALLIDAGSNVNEKDSAGYVPLHHVESSEVAAFLIEHGADIEATSTYGYTPLHCAAAFDDRIEVLKYLLSKGAKIEARFRSGETALHWASTNGSIKAVEILLDSGADIEARATNKGTPLHTGTFGCHLNVIEFLIKRDADINAKNNLGETPLHIAVIGNQNKVAAFLLDKGAVIDSFAYNPSEFVGSGNDKLYIRNGGTPLNYAARNGGKHIVEFLIDKGADVNSGSEASGTPLINAVLFGHKDIVETLIRAGADVNATTYVWRNWGGPPGKSIRSSTQQTALDLAQTPEIKALLRAHGGKTGEELGAEQEKK